MLLVPAGQEDLVAMMRFQLEYGVVCFVALLVYNFTE